MTAFILALLLIALCVFFEHLKGLQLLEQSRNDAQGRFAPIAPLSSKWKRLFSLVGFEQEKRQESQNHSKSTEKAVTLMLKPSKEKYFEGRALKKAFHKLGLAAGEDGFLYKARGIRPLYTVCHLYQPGTFALHQLEVSSYSGCLFILCLSESENPLGDFDLMLEDFQEMAQLLKAQSLDENGEPLSLSNLNYIRDQIAR